MSADRNNLEVRDFPGQRHDLSSHAANSNRAGEEYGFTGKNNTQQTNSTMRRKKYVLRSPTLRNYQSNRHSNPHLQQKKSLEPINITYGKQEGSNSSQSELQRLRETVQFLSKKLQDRGEPPLHPQPKEKLLLTEVTWLKKALKQEQQRSETLTKQLSQIRSHGSKPKDLDPEIKISRAESQRMERRPSEQEIQSNNRKIAKIQQEMMNMREDVSRLKDVIIDQRVYISQLEIQLGILRELQGSRVGTSGWPYLQQKSDTYETYQRQSSLKTKSDEVRNLSLPH